MRHGQWGERGGEGAGGGSAPCRPGIDRACGGSAFGRWPPPESPGPRTPAASTSPPSPAAATPPPLTPRRTQTDCWTDGCLFQNTICESDPSVSRRACGAKVEGSSHAQLFMSRWRGVAARGGVSSDSRGLPGGEALGRAERRTLSLLLLLLTAPPVEGCVVTGLGPMLLPAAFPPYCAA